MYKRTLLKTLFALSILVTSCASKKDIVYFQDEPLRVMDESNIHNYELKYKTDDLLTIDVSALNPESAMPFNLPAVSYNSSVISAQGSLKMQTYLIDINGDIEFPVLGKIKLGGLTRTQSTNFLKEKLTEYIKEPIVNIRLANFTVSVLGEVARPGTFTIQDERVTLPEALGLAGDLTIQGNRKNVLLIREVDGQKRFSKIDLTSINIVNSPIYYLEQNDVLYVEPNNAKVRQSSYNQNNGVIIAAVSTLATIAAILIK
ncbi:polysaccharide biosynthesis/export family protein [Meridianimaribacter flavus]|jgi:polysaccharide export outer membrane protein|uniref:Polysaccharide export outer membrane protein n=1 Tax=Meridianimaribacter flavus TaxID=571115 RepID=A0ABY2G5S4_9FLAO|nr:polysaccharide biosynthesis/export family protein [Meridianimaribacter flavus]RYH74586.1 polysaccharide export protein [Flavobacteriaceae bacterium 144Ye]TDY12402.1 polysaccharide export outer membrane protein [Meridianimaribacter flavus]